MREVAVASLCFAAACPAGSRAAARASVPMRRRSVAITPSRRSLRRAGPSTGRSAPSTTPSSSAASRFIKEVCSSCHSMRLLSYRNLGEPGGPEFSPAAVEVLPAQVASDGRTQRQGRDVQAPGAPVRLVPLAFPNAASRAGRQQWRAAARPLGYGQGAGRRPRLHLCDADRLSPSAGRVSRWRRACTTTSPFPAIRSPCRRPCSTASSPIPMGPSPRSTITRRDVSAYLMWTAEPKLEERHKLGARVMIFLIVFAVIMFLAKRAVWARLHGNHASA